MNGEESRLGDYFVSRRERGKAGLPTLSVTLDRGLVRRDSLDRKTDTALADEEHLRVHPGDIAYNMMRMWQGASGLAHEEALVSPAYVVLAPKQNVDPRFAAYLFKLPEMVHRFWAYSYGLTNDRLRLYFNDFKRIPRALPPVPEQRKIAGILSTWDAAIETTEKLLANAEAQKRTLMNHLFAGRMLANPAGTDSSGWKRCELGEVFSVQLGKMLNKKAKSGDEQWPYLTNVDVRWGRIEIDDLNTMTFTAAERRKFRLLPGDLLVCEGGEVGRSAIWRGQMVECYYQKALHRLRPIEGRVLSEFMYFFLEYASRTNYLRDYTSRSSIAHLTREKLLTLLVPVPPLQDQQRIIAILSSCDKEIEALSAQQDSLEREKSALMQQLLTGKLRVTL